jgi:hypothetical protein
MGFSAKHGSANVGWVVFDDHVTLIDAPPAELKEKCFVEIKATTGRAVRDVVLTRFRQGEVDSIRLLLKSGIRVLGAKDAVDLLRTSIGKDPALAEERTGDLLQGFSGRQVLEDAHRHLDILDLGYSAGPGNAAVLVREGEVLFAGAVCANGPRAELPGSDTRRWIQSLEELEKLPVRTVVPGFGSVGGPELLGRERRFLLELRRQVSYFVSQGRALDSFRSDIRIAPEWLLWMPYDHPFPEDISHVYRELTVPEAPFGRGAAIADDGAAPRALALIGDRYHDPAHLEAGLREALGGAGISLTFAVDVRALSRENLKSLKLLVILRDGMNWPDGQEKPYVVWMTPEQERAVVDFVEAGGGLLTLHNSTGLYPEGGPYLKLLGGTYQGHGPLERFRVKVVDPEHPVTRGVSDYEIADEQHTPVPDTSRVHILLESRSDEGVTAAAGWVHEAGKGRVCYLANGHTREAMLHPMYQRLMRNAALWCLRKESQRP